MKKLIIALLIFIIIGLLAGGAYVFFMTDFFKTPEQLFKKYLLTGVIDLTQMEYEPYGKTFTRLSEEQAQISYIGFDSTNENTIEVNYLSNPIDKKAKMDFFMKVEGNEYLSVSAIIAEEIFGIQMKDIHDKYLALENRDLKKLAGTFDSQESFEKIPNEIIFPEKMTQEEKEKMIAIIAKYVAKINEAIPAERYIVEKQVAATIDTENLTVDKYSLIMDEKEFSLIILNTMLELLADNEFLTLCEGRVDTQTIETLKESINDFIIELEKQTKQNQIKFSVYVENKSTRKIEIISKTGTTEWFLKNTEIESNLTIRSVLNKTSVNKVASESIFEINNKFENNVGTLIIAQKTTYNSKDVKSVEKDISDLFSQESQYKNSETKITISSNVSDNSIKGEIILEGFETEEETPEMKNKFEIEFKEVGIDELNAENALILNDYSAEDFTNLGNELITNALRTANDKPNSLVGSFAMLLTFFAPQTEEMPNLEGDFFTEDVVTDSEQTDISVEEPIEENNEKNNVFNYVLAGLNQSLTEFKDELAVNENANLGDFLTVENVQEECPGNYSLELLDGTTMKCIINEQEVYYITMNINGETLQVDEIVVYTEEEYSNI